MNTYGKGVIAVTVERFSKSALKMSDTTVDGRSIERTAWIFSAPFCYMRYIDDARYLLRDKTPGMVRKSPPRQNDVSFI